MLRIQSRRLVLIGAMVAVLAVAIATGVLLLQREPPEKLYLALAVPLQTEGGRAIADGVQLAVADINRAGGIGGHMLEVLTFDDENDPAKAVQIAEEVSQDDRVVAVLGHLTSTASIPAGEVYRSAGIPAISGTATATNVTEGNEWYFRTIYDNKRQARFMAWYMGEVLSVERVAVLSGQDEFGLDLTQSFLDVVLDHETMDVTVTGQVDSFFDGQEVDEAALNRFIDSIPEGTQAIYFATFAREAAWVIGRLHDMGRKYIYVGSDALADAEFSQLAGALGDGVYVPSPVIFDAGNERTLLFRERFVETNGYEPGPFAATFYDAAAITAGALQRILASVPLEETPPVAELRGLLREDFAGHQTNPAYVYRGVTSDILFDGEGNALGEIEVGVYNRQRLLSAPVQLRIDDHSADGALQFTRMDVVFVGIDLAALSNVDAERGIYDAEFLLSFRQQADANGESVLFTNEVVPVQLGRPILVREEGGIRTEVYRFKGTFISEFDFSRFPFDTQTLTLGLIHSGLGTDALQYALEESAVTTTRLQGGDFGTSGEWRLKGFTMTTTASNIGRGLGSLSFLVDESAERSGLEARITLERDVISAGFKNLFPIFVVIVMLYTTLFLPVTARQERLTVAVSSLLAVAFFSTGISNVARPGHLIGMDYFYLTAYALAFTNLSLTVFLNTSRFQGWASTANRTVMVLYPLAVAFAVTSFVV